MRQFRRGMDGNMTNGALPYGRVPFVPQFGMPGQADERQAANFIDNARRSHRPLQDVVRELDQSNIPPQLRQVPYKATIASQSTAYLLLPANPLRISFIIGAPYASKALQFSYAFPTNGAGLPIPAGTIYQETNGSVSIDDIYIFSTDVGDDGLTIVGYEGLLAVESQAHQQTRGAL